MGNAQRRPKARHRPKSATGTGPLSDTGPVSATGLVSVLVLCQFRSCVSYWSRVSSGPVSVLVLCQLLVSYQLWSCVCCRFRSDVSYQSWSCVSCWFWFSVGHWLFFCLQLVLVPLSFSGSGPLLTPSNQRSLSIYPVPLSVHTSFFHPSIYPFITLFTHLHPYIGVGGGGHGDRK